MTKEKFSIWLIPSHLDDALISKLIQSLSKNTWRLFLNRTVRFLVQLPI